MGCYRNTYDSGNRKTSSGLCIRYAVELVDYAWYRVTRVATKRYSYVGMWRESAITCRDAMIAQYTRSHVSIVEGASRPEGTLPASVSATSCMATAIITHQYGILWRVDVTVNERDVAASLTAPTDPASLFNTSGWTYDEPDAEYINLESVYYNPNLNRVTFGCSFNIDEYDPERLIAEWKDSATALSWTRILLQYNGYFPYSESSAYAAGQLFRLRYGGLTSETKSAVRYS